MNKNRLATPLSVAAGFILLCASPRLTGTQSSAPSMAPVPSVASPVSQATKDPFPADDFAGFDFTDEQKTEIDKIRQDTKSRKEAVVKDQKLTADQKDAMLLGYARLEYSQIYKALTPVQRKEVQQRIRARRAEDPAAQKKQPVPNQNGNTPAK